MNFFDPIEPPRLSQPINPTVPQLTATIALQVVENVLLKSENAILRREMDDFVEMFGTPWRG